MRALCESLFLRIINAGFTGVNIIAIKTTDAKSVM